MFCFIAEKIFNMRSVIYDESCWLTFKCWASLHSREKQTSSWCVNHLYVFLGFIWEDLLRTFAYSVGSSICRILDGFWYESKAYIINSVLPFHVPVECDHFWYFSVLRVCLNWTVEAPASVFFCAGRLLTVKLISLIDTRQFRQFF